MLYNPIQGHEKLPASSSLMLSEPDFDEDCRVAEQKKVRIFGKRNRTLRYLVVLGICSLFSGMLVYDYRRPEPAQIQLLSANFDLKPITEDRSPEKLQAKRNLLNRLFCIGAKRASFCR